VSAGPLILRLRSLRGDMQPALGRIADLILADPGQVAGMTIGRLAKAADCSEATVVRFARELGCGGYRDLRFQLLEESVTGRDAAQDGDGPDGDLDPSDDLPTLVAKIATGDAQAVQDTARGLDLEALSRIARQVVTSQRIVLGGMGASSLPAADEQQKLFRIGLPSAMFHQTHEALAAAALMDPGDVAVLFSHTGRTREILDMARVARDAGAQVVAITGSAASPLAQLSDEVLLTSATESAMRSGATASRIAQLTVADCLFVAVATLLPDLGRGALERTRAAVEGLRD
jgi:DNA-binding MurR/RpiR family transcriptional regulator